MANRWHSLGALACSIGFASTSLGLPGLDYCQRAPHDRLCSFLPHDVRDNASPDDFTSFSWQSFVALNWPAMVGGAPSDAPIGSSPETTRVWEHYIAPGDVFRPDGTEPRWSKRRLPEACAAIAESRRSDAKVVDMASKASVFLRNGDLEAAVGKPLIDQRQNFIVAEIRLNREEFDYIVRHKFFDAAAQERFGGKVQMPRGVRDGDRVGAVEIKAAWRILDPQRDSAIIKRYYTQSALVYVLPGDTVAGEPLCAETLLGLAGFHIAHKTETAPEWIRSTFEQVDNVRRGPGLPSNISPTLNNPDCNDTGRCPHNLPTPKKRILWQSSPAYALGFAPTQVIRVTPIPPAIQAANEIWQAKLRETPDSPWQFYELVGTQYPSRPRALEPARLLFGYPQPDVLANTTMETYLQPTSSCIQCHGSRSTMVNNDVFPDFSFLLSHACYSPGYPQPVLRRPCATLMLGDVSPGETKLRPVRITPEDPATTRLVKLEQGAGSFALVCNALGDVDLSVEANSDITFAGGASSARLTGAGEWRQPLQLGPDHTPPTGFAKFSLHSNGGVARVWCMLVPL